MDRTASSMDSAARERDVSHDTVATFHFQLEKYSIGTNNGTK